MTESSAQQVRRRVGYVIQEGGLFPHLTARANVLLLSRHLGRPASEMEERLENFALCRGSRGMDSIAIPPSFPGDNANASA